MSCLYICNQQLSESDCQNLAALMNKEDAVLLIADGSYLIGSAAFVHLVNKYVLKTDLQIRGVPFNDTKFELIKNYEAMVELTLKFDKTLTWTI